MYGAPLCGWKTQIICYPYGAPSGPAVIAGELGWCGAQGGCKGSTSIPATVSGRFEAHLLAQQGVRKLVCEPGAQVIDVQQDLFADVLCHAGRLDAKGRVA